MTPQWITIYAVFGVTLGLCAFLFRTVRQELRVTETRDLRRVETLRSQLQELKAELETVRRGMELMEQRSDPVAAVARTMGSGVRVQAIRMIRHGESPESIAAELGLPRTEVDLLVKVQRLLGEHSQATS